jgi:hypothetical protein
MAEKIKLTFIQYLKQNIHVYIYIYIYVYRYIYTGGNGFVTDAI